MKSKKPKNQRMLFVFFIFIVGILCIIAFQVQKQFKKKKKVEKEVTVSKVDSKTERVVLVTVKEAKKSDYLDVIPGVTGKIDVARAKLGFEIAGKISIIASDKGDAVRKGDILAELDKSDLYLKERYKRTSYEAAEIELKKAKKILEENKEKAKTGYILETKLKDYELDVKLKENKVKAAKLEIEAAIVNLKKAELRAPFDGVVLDRSIELGESVSTNREAFILLDINNIFADIEINEKKISKIEPGQKITLKTSIYADIINGTIQSIVPAVQGKAMILSARAKLENAEVTLLPGMFVIGDILAYEQKDVIAYPLESIFKEEKEIYVFKYDDKSGTVKKCPVKLGYVTRKEALISQGISVCDKVVIETTSALKDGMSVKVDEE